MSNITKRLLSVFLVLCMLSAWVLPASAHEAGVSFTQVSNDRVSASLFGKDPVQLEEQAQYADNEIVRVSIFMDAAGVIDAGFAVEGLAVNDAAMAYRQQLQLQQDALVEKIEKVIKEELDVVWQLTLATNLISANVKYGQIAAIEKVAGVSEVVIETVYTPDVVSSSEADPNMATSSIQTGTGPSYMAGYTGAGSKVAIIDTGLDIQHLSFDASAYEYSLSLLAEEAGVSLEEYVEGLDLLDAEKIASVLEQLNVAGMMPSVSAEDLYINSKIPFGFNYVDENLNVEHLKDGQGEHGSHVAGIATANAYVPNGDGTYAKALEKVFVQGVAPDAQVIVMKVFGVGGGAYDSDYMAAIEDAVLLGVDSVNLSLGSGNPGMSRNSTAKYQAILESLEKSGVVVAMSAGNAYAWMSFAEGTTYMYLDDVSMQTDGSPGSFTNSLAVASVDNAGFVSPYVSVISVNGKNIAYYDSNNYGTSYGNLPFTTLKGQHEFVFLNGVGKPEEFAALGEDALKGKIALCYRGETSFFEKCNAAVEAGAIGVIVVNNVDELFGMNLTGYNYQAPAVSISLSQGEAFKMDPIMGEDDVVLGWTGTLEVPVEAFAGVYEDAYYTMSEFSSWGVPGSLELKPEITAPGGDILSVNGANKAYSNYAHDQYEVMGGTSMASPQVAGMAALLAQYIRENNLTEKTGLDARTLAQSLLMSTSVPVMEGENGGYYYSILKQGSGLANVGAAVMADSYILMNPDATKSWADGKVKVELGDDPDKTGVYTFSFTINNLTNSTKVYALSADFFTQGAFSDGYALYMDTWTTALNPIVVFAVDGQQLKEVNEKWDFNADGVVDFADGYFLLEAVLSGKEVPDADMNGDEVVTSYDALLFFQELGACSAEVPANGSATVEVTVTLSESDRQWLSYYENGAYLEGFVYAETMPTEEGVEGTVHSIPVLGFYGNWSDASMYDKGSYEEYALSGEETRAPYLYTTNFANGYVNALYVTYAGDTATYYFGGNPLLEDEVYMPERNAISGVNGDMISKIGFTNIRNAADAYFQVLDLTNGEVLISESLGAMPSAYYYVNGQVWKNTYWNVSTSLNFAGIADNTLVDVGMCLIPEYYVDAEGNVNWEALGNGTTFSMSMTVDNTAPTVEKVVVDEENNVMTITALDNQYIAAVALYDLYGEHIYTYVGSNAEAQAGESGEFQLDLTDVGGSCFLLQVYDYAMNCSTYEIDQQIGEVVDEIESITISQTSMMMAKGTAQQLTAIVRPFNASDRGVIWTSSDETVATVENGKVVAVGAGSAVITATAKADETFIATCSVTVVELNVTLNGVLQDEDGNPMLFSWDLANDSTWTAGAAVGQYFNNLIYDPYTEVLYGQSAQDTKMYAVDPVTGETVCVSGTCAFGAAVSDIAASPCYATKTEPYLVGVYGTYFLTHNTPSQNTFASGFNLASYLANYTKASKFVAICDYGASVVNGAYWDTYFALDNAGYLWLLKTNGSNAQFGMYPTDLDLTYPTSSNGSQYCSLVCDEVGDLYLAYFTGSTSEIYYLTFNGKGFSSMYVGNVGADVWPAALSAVETNVSAEPTEPAAANVIEEIMAAAQFVDVTEELQSISAADLVESNASTQAVGGAILDTDRNTVTVAVTAKDVNGNNVESNNGVITIHYDPAAQTLQNVAVHADFYVVDQTADSVTFAYVNLNKFAPSDLVATLVFNVVDESAAGATVEYKEVNEGYNLQTEVEMQSSTLMQALADLEQAIADGDQNLSDKIDALNVALRAAIQSGDAAVKGELSASIASVSASLRAMVTQVSNELDAAKVDLAAAIAAGDKALEDKIAALNTALETAVAASTAANEALSAELSAELETAVAALNTNIETSVATLNAAIEQVVADLAAAKTELNAAIEEAIAALTQADENLNASVEKVAGDLNAAIEQAIAALTQADQNLNASVEQVAGELATTKQELNASLEQAAANLAAAKKELNDAIAAGDKNLADEIAALNAALNAAVDAAEAANETLATELNARLDEAVAALNAALAQTQKDLADAKAELAAQDAQLQKLVTVAIVLASVAVAGCLALLALVLLKKRA